MPSPKTLKGIASTTARMDWPQFDPWGGLQGMAAVAFLLGLGLAFHNTIAGAIAAGGALSIGLGSFDRKSFKSIPILLTAALLMGISALVGTFTGSWGLWAFLPVGLWGFTGGLLIAADTALWFIGLKAVVTLLVAGGYPSDFSHAFQRGLLVFCGCLVQVLFLFLEARLAHKLGGPRRTQDPTPFFPKAWRNLSANLSFRSPAFRHAMRLAVVLVIGKELGRLLLPHNVFWLPLTVVVVLRPGFQETILRGLARVGGTFLGAGVTTLIVMAARPEHPILALLALIFAWLSFAFFRVNYALYAVFITGYVVFMLSFGGLPEMEVLQVRLLATAMGGALALLGYLLWPTPYPLKK